MSYAAKALRGDGVPAPAARVHRSAVPAGRSRARPAEPRHVSLLGGFALSVGGRAVSVAVTAQRLVALLALHGRSGRSRLAGSLWPEMTEARAMANLRNAIWRVNQSSPGLVVPDRDALALASDVEVDVTSLVTSAHRVMDGTGSVPVTLALPYVHGDLLPDWGDEWLVADRERLRQLRLHVLEAMAARLAAEGLFGMALEAALAALRADPLRESAHRAVIRIHLAEGNLAEAVHAYRRCRALLAREFGVAPSDETVRLVRALPRALHTTG